MDILFASGDVGGARALLPVIECCAQKGLSFAVLNHGHIIQEVNSAWNAVYLEKSWNEQTLQHLLKISHAQVIVFTSSVHDITALSLARQAQQLVIPTIHILDNWTGYRKRMEMDGLPVFVPNVYAVMDNLACEEAVKDGILRSILVVTGQPALSSLSLEFSSQTQDILRRKRGQHRLHSDKAWILFVSEPVESDQGASVENPGFRGYTEKIVLQLFCEALQPFSEDIEVGVLPHPREDPETLSDAWEQYHGSLHGGLARLNRGREGIFLADGIAGMASILLYEAWLIGKPVISLQPGLQIEPLRMLAKREGVKFVDSYKHMKTSIVEWGSTLQPERETMPRPELAMHNNSPQNVVKLIEQCLQQTSASYPENILM